jgi:hypothetical protein
MTLKRPVKDFVSPKVYVEGHALYSKDESKKVLE